MGPKIGIKAVEILKTLREHPEFNAFEAYGRDSKFSFNKNILNIVKKETSGKELSMHSQTKKIFSYSDDKDFTDGEMMALKTEILMCEFVNAKELIVHFKDNKLDANEAKLFKGVEKFAKKHNVEVLYEINGEFNAESFFDFLNKFPKMNVCIDLGHLNFAIGTKTIGMGLDEFLEKAKKRAVYVHAHNNNGLKDEHKSLDDGTLDWKHALDMLDLNRIKKIIIENEDIQDIIKSKKLLEDYLREKAGKQ